MAVVACVPRNMGVPMTLGYLGRELTPGLSTEEYSALAAGSIVAMIKKLNYDVLE